MIKSHEAERTVALYDDNMPSYGRSSSIVALRGTPGKEVSLIGSYHAMDEVPKAHINDKNILVVDLSTAMHIFHFKPRKTGAQSL